MHARKHAVPQPERAARGLVRIPRAAAGLCCAALWRLAVRQVRRSGSDAVHHRSHDWRFNWQEKKKLKSQEP